MMHSKNFDKVKTFFDTKMWGEDRVRNAVLKGWITEEEFVEIVGVEY